MSKVLLHCFLICLIQKSFSQVIANSPYYANTNNGYGLSNAMPIVNTLTPSSAINGMIGNGISPGLAMNGMTNAPLAPVYTAVPNEVVVNNVAPTALPANAAISAGVTGLEGFSLGGMPMSGVSPMGYGDVSILGELPVGGSTGVTGNVPVIGYVTFEGTIPAGGTVTLASNCGCSNPTIY